MAVLYTAHGPYYGIPFRVSVDLRDASNDLVALASADSEISKDGGAFADCTNEAAAGSLGTGFAELTFTAAEMSCNRFVAQIKGTNHKTAVIHGTPKHDVIFIGTISAHTSGTPSITLNTTDQTGSATNGYYDGCWVKPIAGTGAGQNGRFASTESQYNGTTKVLTLANDFAVALDNTTVVMIYASHVSNGLVEADVEAIAGNTSAPDALADIANGDQLLGVFLDDDSKLDAILEDTAEIGAAGIGLTEAGGTGDQFTAIAKVAALAALDAKVVTIDGIVDSILEDTGTTLDGKIDAIDNYIDTEIATLVSGVNVTAINGSTAAAVQLALSAAAIESGEAEGTPTTTVIQTNLAETQNDIYIGRILIFTSGDARGEATDITDYTGATGTLTVTALANAPAAGDSFVIL